MKNELIFVFKYKINLKTSYVFVVLFQRTMLDKSLTYCVFFFIV